MKVLAAFLVSMALLATGALAQGEHTLQVDVTINNTANSVYVSGDILPSGSLTNETFEPDPFFIASYDSSSVLGLAANGEGEVATGRSGGSHTISLSQPIGNPTLLAFTEGDWETIDGRMGLIESGDFFRRITPSFAFGLGTEYAVRAVLHYPDIDIRGALQSSKGIYRLAIENKGVSGGKPIVEIKPV